MTNNNKQKLGWQAIRMQVLERDNYTCVNCGRSRSLDVHHIIPRHKQGLDSLNNLFAFCEKCHYLIELRSYRPRSYIINAVNSFRSKKVITYFKFVGRITSMGERN